MDTFNELKALGHMDPAKRTLIFYGFRTHGYGGCFGHGDLDEERMCSVGTVGGSEVEEESFRRADRPKGRGRSASVR